MASSNVAGIAHRKAMAMARNVQNIGPLTVAEGALAFKQHVERELHSAAPSGRLKGVGAKGAKLGIRYDVKGSQNPTALLRATGPWQLIEHSTQSHVIVAKRLGKNRAGRSAAAGNAQAFAAFGGGRGAFGGLASKTTTTRKGLVKQRAGQAALGGGLAQLAGGPRPYAHHPGTRGKRPWAKGIDAGREPAIAKMRTATSSAVMKGLRS